MATHDQAIAFMKGTQRWRDNHRYRAADEVKLTAPKDLPESYPVLACSPSLVRSSVLKFPPPKKIRRKIVPAKQ